VKPRPNFWGGIFYLLVALVATSAFWLIVFPIDDGDPSSYIPAATSVVK
jgi:hypothetical protein